MKRSLNILLIISLFFLGINNCYATEVQDNDRENLKNYGVNKHWTITESNKSNVLNTPYVDAEEKIYDYSNALTEQEKKELKNKIDEYIKQTNMDMVILISEHPYTYDSANETFAVDFYDYNDFGIEFENYSGVILFRNTYQEDPYFNIYTFGNAQLYYPFETCETILDDIYYDLKNHNYLRGFSTFIDEMSDYARYGIPYDMRGYAVDKDGYLIEKYAVPYIEITMIALIITIIIMIILITKNKMVVTATNAHEYLDRKSINYTWLQDDLINTHTTSYTTSSSSGGGGGFGGSSGGSSGGGHGGGGGRHG